MRRIPLRFCALALCLIGLNLTGLFWLRHELHSERNSATAPLRIVETLPKSDADLAERLSLVFDREAGEPARLNAQLDEAAPFEIQPSVPGHWEWTTARQLDYVLAEPLPSGRRFEVAPASGLETQLGRVVHVSAELGFQTAPLKLTECLLVSADRNDVTFELRFNQKVAPTELVRQLTIGDAAAVDAEAGDDVTDDALDGLEISGRPHRKVKCLVNEPSTSLVLRCARPEEDALRIELAESLTGSEAERPLEKKLVRTLKLSPVFAFLRTEVEEPGFDGQSRIDVFFSTGLSADQEIPSLEVAPRVDDLRGKFSRHWNANGNLLRLTGSFEGGRQYRFTLPATLLAMDGKPLGEDCEVNVRIPDRRPRVSFPDSNGVLSPHGNLSLNLNTVNVSGLRISASNVHANNLVAHLQGTWKRRTSRSLPTTTLRLDQTKNQTVSSTLELESLLHGPSGLYHIQASATDEAWVSDSALVTVTDLGLTLKQSTSELLVWVTSLRHATPVAGVRVSSVSFNNQTLAVSTTDADGLARLRVDRKHADGEPWVIIAEQPAKIESPSNTESKTNSDDAGPPSALPSGAGQIAWLQTDEAHWLADDVNQSGRPHPEALDVMLYSERGTYRPGDLIHLSGIIRDDLGKVPPGFPIEMHVTRPDGRETAAEIITHKVDDSIAAQGLFHFEYQTPLETWTGPWRFHVTLPGSPDEIASAHVYVEEFIPVRIDVEAAPTKQLFTSGERPAINVAARYLFGTPAANLQTTVSVFHKAERFQSKAFPKFVFGPRKLDGRNTASEVIARLDAVGHALIDLPHAPDSMATPWRASVNVTVTEEGGRSVSTHSGLRIDQQTHHVGLHIPGGRVVPVKQELTAEWTLRTPEDQPADFETLSFELLRVDHENVLRRVDGRAVWESRERTASVWAKTVDQPADSDPLSEDKQADAARTDAPKSLALTCPEPGYYRLVAQSKSGSRTEIDLIAVGPNGQQLTRPLEQPERIDIQFDREQCLPGETVNAVITSPFPGRMLLSLEADQVLWSTVAELESTSTIVPINVPADVRGGCFLTATVLRPIDPAAKEWLPHRARGIARVLTDHAAQKLPVTIDAPQQVDPATSEPVSVQTLPGAIVQLWAVDEGILATTGFSSPNPYSHFYAARRNDVLSSDVFSNLLPDHEQPSSMHRIGGDDGGDDPLRRNPVATKRRDPAVIWQSFRQADADGKLTLNVTLPQFTGELRWMAVALHGDRYGAADVPMIVTSPLLVEVAWPRFAAPDDEFHVPARVFNTTDVPLTVRLDTSVTGPLELAISKSSITVPPGGSQIVWLKAKSGQPGPVEGAVIVTSLDGDGSTSREVRNPFALPVRPATSLQTERNFVTIKLDEALTLAPAESFRADSTRLRISLSSEPGLDLKPALDDLLQYPYGCVEQTSSQMRALLAAGQWLNSAEGDDRRQEVVNEMLQSGASRLWSMQGAFGGLSYWPGQADAHTWGSAYAAETLLDARDRGVPVDARLLTGLQKFLDQTLARSGNDIDAGTRAAICHVLSRLGHPSTGWMSVLTERIDELDMDGRAHLALAWLHAGRRDQALAALPENTINLGEHSSYQGRFTSPVAQRARLLSALVQLDPQHQWIPQLANSLHAARTNGVWLSTLDNALALEALAARKQSSADTVSFAGTIEIGDVSLELKPGETKHVTVSTFETAPTLIARGAGELFASIETTGLAKTLPQDDDRQIRVRRRWLTRDGHPVDPQRIAVGDLVLVEVELKSVGRRSIASVAVVDALPAGMEIENPRLSTSDQSASGAEADHVQFLDDRVVVFGKATPRGQTFRYALRAITDGDFTLPPIQASCMYNESISSIHGAGQIRVRAPGREEPERLAVQPDATGVAQ
jgi:uncharacterized protein YfaS (alpha-2-macroglobulin family)